MDKILVMDEHNYDENLDEIYTVSVRGIIPTNVKIFQLPHSTCRIIGQHALCGKENLAADKLLTIESSSGKVILQIARIYSKATGKSTLLINYQTAVQSPGRMTAND